MVAYVQHVIVRAHPRWCHTYALHGQQKVKETRSEQNDIAHTLTYLYSPFCDPLLPFAPLEPLQIQCMGEHVTSLVQCSGLAYGLAPTLSHEEEKDINTVK